MANGMRRWLAHIGSESATIGPKLHDGTRPEYVETERRPSGISEDIFCNVAGSDPSRLRPTQREEGTV
jgi:hypothetical protein